MPKTECTIGMMKDNAAGNVPHSSDLTAKTYSVKSDYSESKKEKGFKEA